LNSIFTGIQEVTKEAGIKENGFRVVMNYGRDAEELVLHLHVHIIAGRHLNWPPG
jgi:histidine triad (HIT) family protein